MNKASLKVYVTITVRTGFLFFLTNFAKCIFPHNISSHFLFCNMQQNSTFQLKILPEADDIGLPYHTILAHVIGHISHMKTLLINSSH